MIDRKRTLFAALGATLVLGGAAAGQQFDNGDFETGSLDPWAVRPTPNGQTLVQNVTLFEIKGPGTGRSYAGEFGVGQVTFASGVQEGIDVVQELQLQDGVEYTVEFDWAALRLTASLGNAHLGNFGVSVDGVLIDEVDAGAWAANQPAPTVGSFSANFTATRTGPHVVGVRITRRFLPPGDMFQYIDNVEIRGGPAGCYPDCDGNNQLDFFDFLCFQNAFLAQDPYADCDQNNVFDFFDFLCFQNEFLAGCP